MTDHRFTRFEGMPFEEPLRRRYRRLKTRRLAWSSLFDLALLIIVLGCVVLALTVVIVALTAVLIVAPFFILAAGLVRLILPRSFRPPPPAPRDLVIDVDVERS